ncbi:MerR [Serinibacter salmoneus]|uniref:MerR n=1 Tax=Serinibacter salmoneus TaxID=556530 RepID=UPI000BF2D096|nr:MerR [Serinibacter salmoneus]
MTRTFNVRLEREGRWWVAVADGIPGAATETARLADLGNEMTDLLAGLLDLDEDDISLTWDASAVLGAEGNRVWNDFLAERDDLARRQAELNAKRDEALLALRDGGVSIRDSAVLVGLSHQRVAQLLQ